MSKIIIGKIEEVEKNQLKKYSDSFDEIIGNKHGIYALFKRTRGRDELKIHYVGKATQLKSRIEEHLKKKKEWSCFSLYLTRKKEYIDEIEALILSIHTPKGNDQKPKVKAKNLWEELRKIESKQMGPSGSRRSKKSKTNSKVSFSKKDKVKDLKNIRCYYEVKDVRARGNYLGDSKLQVLKGSTCCLKEAPGASKAIIDKRSELKERGILKEKNGVLVFTKNKVFNSPSGAALVVSGRETNGWTSWKTKDKKTLKELRK